MSFSSYIRTVAAGTSDYIGIPAFVSRLFRHSGIYVRTDAGINKPEDLRGKRIGLPEYQITAVVWMRGMLQHEYGVKPNEIHWRNGGQEEPGRDERTPLKPIPGLDLQAARNRADAGQHAARRRARRAVHGAGAVILPHGRAAHRAAVARYRAAEKAYYKKTGTVPDHASRRHPQVAGQEHPVAATSVFKAFQEAKALAMIDLLDVNALMVTLPWLVAETQETHGRDGQGLLEIRRRREPARDRGACQYLHEQGLTDRKVARRGIVRAGDHGHVEGVVEQISAVAPSRTQTGGRIDGV